MAENTLALLQYLSSPKSPLPTLTSGYTKPETVFFHSLTFFFVFSFQTAKILYSSLLVLSIIYVKFTFVPPAPALKQGRGIVAENLKGFGALTLGFFGALIAANAVAFVMRGPLDKALSWFSAELSCLLLYGPPALAGKFISYVVSVERLT